MTGLAARHYGVTERGLLVQGHMADVVVFDADTVTDRATFEQPIQTSAGIELVFVNGHCVWDGENTTGAVPGRVLTRSAAHA